MHGFYCLIPRSPPSVFKFKGIWVGDYGIYIVIEAYIIIYNYT